MNYSFLNGESLSDLSFPSTVALWLTGLALQHHGYNQVTVTYVRSGQHMDGSLHPVGDALDIRTRDWAERRPIVYDIRALLPSIYDIVLEPDHLHIEYDPAPDKIKPV